MLVALQEEIPATLQPDGEGGGLLVYATRSILPEENRQQDKFAANAHFRLLEDHTASPGRHRLRRLLHGARAASPEKRSRSDCEVAIKGS